MHRYVFLAFAFVCLAQRVVEIVRNDRNVADRRPNWTAIVLCVLFVGFSVGSVIESFVADRPFSAPLAILGSCLFAAGFIIRRWVLRSLFLPLYVVALAARIRIEEAALVNRLGDEYRSYRHTTFALLPIPKWQRR